MYFDDRVLVADRIVRLGEVPSLVVVDEHRHRAVMLLARQSPALTLAVDQPPLEIERRAVATDRFAHQLRLLSRHHAEQMISANIDEVPETVRVP